MESSNLKAKGLEEPIRMLGAIAQLGERLLCKQEVSGSIPLSSTIKRRARNIKEKIYHLRMVFMS